MVWNTRADYIRQGGSATPLADKLNDLGFAAMSPGRTIIKSPNNLETAFRDGSKPDDVLLKELMANFWNYGRGHWSWSGSSGAGANDGGLVKGKVNFCACAAFNNNFAYIAATVMGIQGIEKGNAKPGVTWYKGNFITMPVSGIDSEWVGNVMTHNYSYAALKMFKFTDHYFCNYNGVIFDATGNATHANTDTIVACDLKNISREEAAALHAHPAMPSFEVTNLSPHYQPRAHFDLTQGRWLALALGPDTLIAAGNNQAFNTYLLTKQTKVGQSEIDSFTLESGRTSKKAR